MDTSGIPLPAKTREAKAVPVERIEECAGIYFRSILLEEVGTFIPQHIHDHDHATLVCSGRALAWADGKCLGEFEAGQPVWIAAGAMHHFQALEANTRLCCVHDIESAEAVKSRGL